MLLKHGVTMKIKFRSISSLKLKTELFFIDEGSLKCVLNYYICRSDGP